MLSKTAYQARARRSKKQSQGRAKGKALGNGPSPNAIIYKGPSIIKTDDRIVEVSLTELTQLTTTSVANLGVYNALFKASDVAALSGWADLQTLYSEFRVLSVHVEFIPKFIGYQPSFTTNGASGSLPSRYISPLCLAPFHGDASGLTSPDEAANHEGRKFGPINDRFVATAKMKSVEEASFTNTTTFLPAINDFGIKSYFNVITEGATDVIAWGSLVETLIVQFRTRVKTDIGLDKKDRKDVKCSEKIAAPAGTLKSDTTQKKVTLQDLLKPEYVLVSTKESSSKDSKSNK